MNKPINDNAYEPALPVPEMSTLSVEPEVETLEYAYAYV